MRSALAEKLLSALGVCLLTGAISIVTNGAPLPGAEGARDPITRVLSAAGGTVKRIVDESQNMIAALVNGNPVLVMYSFGSLVLMLMMLRS